jgi:hypothetical protein
MKRLLCEPLEPRTLLDTATLLIGTLAARIETPRPFKKSFAPRASPIS